MLTTSPTEAALLDVLARLAACAYTFTTPTPATHARVVSRAAKTDARDIRDVFGWSLPFREELLERPLLEALRLADALESLPGSRWRSRLRVASCGGDLFLHSAYPTTAHDAVFFGPDSYRFADLIRRELVGVAPGARIVDIGTGSGVGAVVAARCVPSARLVATDINAKALTLAAISARAAGVTIDFVRSADLSALDGDADVVIANPPYVIDDAHRAYRDGGAQHGSAVSLQMARMAIERLAPGGRLVLYTGSAIIGGHDPFERALGELAAASDCTMRYRELDPDVFGEELERRAYAEVERIAVVAAIVTR